MNDWNASPVLQTNEVAGKYTPKEDHSQPKQDIQPEPKHHFLAGDLQKIGRSSHTPDQYQRQDAMDDDEHDEIIKGLLYPGLEESTDSFEFFDEDYQASQLAVGTSLSAATATMRGNSSYLGPNDNHAVHRRSTFDGFMSFNDDNDNSYEASYFAAMGRPYSDTSNQKLRR